LRDEQYGSEDQKGKGGPALSQNYGINGSPSAKEGTIEDGLAQSCRGSPAERRRGNKEISAHMVLPAGRQGDVIRGNTPTLLIRCQAIRLDGEGRTR
jgi:hypothetical protein